MNPEKTIRDQAKCILRNNNRFTAVCVFMTFLVALLFVIYTASAIDTLVAFVSEQLSNGLQNLFGLSSLFDLEADDSSGSVALLLIIAGLIFISPLLTGMIRYFYKLAKNGEADYSETFYYFGKKYFRALSVNLSILARVFWRVILCMLPSSILFTITNVTELANDMPVLAAIINLLGASAFFGGILLSFKFSVKYFLCIFLFIEDENASIRDIIMRSASSMTRFAGSVNKLFFSLSGWIILCVLVIPMIFVLPYILLCMSVSAKWIIALETSNSNNSVTSEELPSANTDAQG